MHSHQYTKNLHEIMDFSSLQVIAAFLISILFYKLWRLRKSSKISRGRLLPPEPAGALPLIGHLHLLSNRRSLSHTFGEMADKYGPIFRLRLGAYPTVIISSHEVVKECYATNGKVFASRPNSAAATYLGYNSAAFVFAPYGPYWREMRKISLIELLSHRRLEQLKQFQVSEVDAFIRELYLRSNKSNEQSTGGVVISQWIEGLVLNTVTSMVAGKRYFCGGDGRDDGEAGRIGNVVKELTRIAGVFVVSDLIPSLGWVDVGGQVKAMKQVSREVDSVISSWIKEHEEKLAKGEKNSNGDFIDVLLSTIEDESMFEHSRETTIKATIMNMIVAGFDTTSITLTWIVANLLNTKHALKGAQEELDLKVGRDRWVQYSDIPNLGYLRAIVKETLRLYPPLPISVPHEAMDDCTVNGYHVAKGTRVFVNQWKLHRDPRVWSDPDKFQPERFLDNHADIDVLGQNFELIPFGSGRRSCPGMGLALQVSHMAIARLLQGFELSTPLDAPVDMTEGLSITLPKVTPLEVVLTPRLSADLFRQLDKNMITQK